MDCEQARDQFSSLWEKELIAPEEQRVRDHLSSCPECQKEFERFGKTMEWLRSVGEVNVPEGFLDELYQKLDERKKTPWAVKSKEKWMIFPLSFKLPIQAVAMVAVVFLVLYLTQLMPMEGSRLIDAKRPPATLSQEKKDGLVWSQKEIAKERKDIDISVKIPLPREMDLARAPVPSEEKPEGEYVPQTQLETQKGGVLSSKTEITAHPPIESKEMARAQSPSPELGKMDKGLAVKEKSAVASKPPQDIILKVSNREIITSKLQELVKEFRGEIVAKEESILTVSLPKASLSEFGQRLMELGSATGEGIVKKGEPERLRALPEKLATDQENLTYIRILVVQE